MLNPLLVKILVDGYQYPQQREYFSRAIALFLVFSIVDPVLTKVTRWWYSYFETKVRRIKSASYLKTILQKDTETYVSLGTGKVLKKLNNGIDAEMSMFNGLFKLWSIVVIRFLAVIIIFMVKLPLMNAVLLVWLALLALLLRLTQKKVGPLYEKIKTINEQTWAKETTIVMEKQVINLASKENQEVAALSSLAQPLDTLKWKADFWNGIGYEGMFVIFRVAEVFSYLWIGRMILTQQASYGDIMMFVALIWQLRWPISSLGEMYADRRKNTARHESLQELLTTPVTVVDGDQKYTYQQGNIEIHDISFAYKDGRNIFSHFSLTLWGGKTIALVGHSGSGKSTLVKLLLRMYDVSDWYITYDWQKLDNLIKKTLYTHVAYLSQEPAVFDGTIRENLAYAFADDSCMDDDAIWGALEKAAIVEMIRSLPAGLDTQLGEKWVKLSWWEKQRLAIARVFLKNPRILILDEPTSALDSVSEHAITRALQELMHGRTVIIIAHRLQTVMHADSIVVMEKGNIVQQWRHEQLVLEDGTYKTLVNLQTGVLGC
jgi:ABC-type multidrug transport system fused ATPase/permease subunit